MSSGKQQGMNLGLEAQGWIKMGKDISKPIRFKTIQKNTKLAEFVEEVPKARPEEQQETD